MARSEKSGAARKTRLDAFVAGNKWVDVFYAPHTFEVDFVDSGNEDFVVDLVGEVWKKATNQVAAKDALTSGDLARFGKLVLQMANQQGKGWFAVQLASTITPHVAVPEYVIEAIHFANPKFSDETWFNILTYRLGLLVEEGACDEDDEDEFTQALKDFRSGVKTLEDLADLLENLFEDDEVNDFLKLYVP